MSIMTPSMERLLDEQYEKWRNADTAPKDAGIRVITFSRQLGSGGRLVAGRVAQGTGLRYWDREIIRKVADRAKADPKSVESRDEKGHSAWDEWLEAIVAQRKLFSERSERQRHLQPDAYLHSLIAVVGEIADGEGGLIVGRGANFILPPEACLRVRVVAPLEHRVARLAEFLGVSSTRAKMLVMRRREERRAFAETYFKMDLDAAEHYDLVLNTAAFTLDQAVDQVIGTWNAVRGGAAPPAP